MRFTFLTTLIIYFICIGCASINDGQRQHMEDNVNAFAISFYPNPCNINSSDYFTDPPYPYMWYYKTIIKNNLDVPLRITDYGFYTYENGKWMPKNVIRLNSDTDKKINSESGAFASINRLFNNEEFSIWNDDGDPVIHGWIKPGNIAISGITWHGTNTKTYYHFLRAKWVYWAEDKNGKTYYQEAEIHSAPIE